MARLAGVCAVGAMSVACGPVEPRPPALYAIGGELRGLWDGAEGVALRLEADGVNTILTIATNGVFGFSKQLVSGASCTVTVASDPTDHTCVVNSHGNGMIRESDVTDITVTCTGPAA